MSAVYWLLAGVALVLASAFGGYRFGHAEAELDATAKQSIATDKLLVQYQTVLVKEPKIIEKFTADTTTIERTYETTIKELPDVFDPNCTMPKRWGELFIGFASDSPTDSTGDAAESAAVYGCAETAKATLNDLKAGRANSAQLNGLIESTKLIEGVK